MTTPEWRREVEMRKMEQLERKLEAEDLMRDEEARLISASQQIRNVQARLEETRRELLKFELSQQITRSIEITEADEIDLALEVGAVHPWTMAQQGEKWRACQDYSAATNRSARSAPFCLPTPWDIENLIIPGKSKFVKYDLRNGFWGVPVAEESKNFLMMRHHLRVSAGQQG